MREPDPDPVIERRARMARLAALGQRLGYGALAVAVVTFVPAVSLGFPSAAVTTVIVCLVAACVLLPPAIILGFAVRAAEREEREEERRR